ncbi:MAG: hypothetical protein ACI8QC_001792 [Planctomycetota bacterium]|jgi:hypothetical protein
MTLSTLLLALTPLCFGLQEPEPGPTQLLAAAREAAGAERWSSQSELRLAGTGTFQGVTGTLSADYAQDRRFALAFEGELTRRTRFDGEALWSAEYSTLWYELEFIEREAELLRGLVHGGAWLNPQLGEHSPHVSVRAGMLLGEAGWLIRFGGKSVRVHWSVSVSLSWIDMPR